VSSVDRRTFLKGVVAATAASAGAAGGQRPGTPTAPVRTLSNSVREPAWRPMPCRLCGVGCGLLVGIEGGRAIAVKGDPASVAGGGLACAKGYYAIETLYGKDRLTRAKIRRGGVMVDVPIGTALDLVANTIRDTRRLHGKDSIALYGSSQWTIPDAYVASKLFKGALGTNNIETNARLSAAGAKAGLASTFGLDASIGCYDDIEHADVIVLWDINLAETDPVLFSRMLAHRTQNPAVRIVELATRTTRTSYPADRTLLHKPRAQLAIANAICQELVAQGQVDRAFVDRHIAFRRGRSGIGYGLTDDALVSDDGTPATWAEYVQYLADFTPDAVQSLAGVPASGIRWLASLYANRARTVMSVWGDNVNQHARGVYANNALYNLHLLVGKIASPGNAALALTGHAGGSNSVHDAGSLTHELPAGIVQDAGARAHASAVWHVPGAQINAHPSRSALPMFRALERGEIKFLWIQATNPMVSLPNLDRYRRAATKEGAFIVVSEAYPTATTEIADVVLPSAMSMERDGVSATAERRLQQFDLMVAPPGESMSDAWQMIEVARRLGFGGLFPAERRGHVEALWEEYRRFHPDSQSGLPSWTVLRETKGVTWPYVNQHETKRRYAATLDPAADPKYGGFDFYGHADHRAWIWLRQNEAPVESPDAGFPFWLTTGPVLEHSGSGTLTQRVPTLHDAMPRAYVELHRDDAQKSGIRDRDHVRVTSRHGSLDLEARIEFRSQPQRGQVFIPSFDATRPVARLMPDAFCPISGQPEMNLCAVRLERLGASGDM
jgi:nitrate reductase NapA